MTASGWPSQRVIASARMPSAMTFSPLVARCQRQKSPGSPGPLASQPTWTWRTRPIAPSRSSRTIVASAQAENVAGTTIATRSGWLRAARSIERASSAVDGHPCLGQDVLAGMERGDRDRRVEDRPGADQHGVDRWIGEQRLPGRVRTLEAERIGGSP